MATVAGSNAREAWMTEPAAIAASPSGFSHIAACRTPPGGRREGSLEDLAAPQASGPPVEVTTARTRPASGGSPWQIQLRARGERGGGGGGGGGTAGASTGAEDSPGSPPVLGIRFPCAAAQRRAHSAARPNAAALPRPSQESVVLLSAVRRQMEALEEKVGVQIGELRCHSDKSPDAATLCRLEEKINNSEGVTSKLGLRVSEISGNVRGLSEEMQAQIRRVDLVDDRLLEWRHQMEEEMRLKHLQFEQTLQQASCDFRATNAALQETQRREHQNLHNLQRELWQRLAADDKKTQDNLADLHGRLDVVEDRVVENTAVAPCNGWNISGGPGTPGFSELPVAELLEQLEKQLGDMAEKVNHLVQDSFETHAHAATQEEQLRALRTLTDAREEHWRSLSEQVERFDWNSKFEHMRQSVHEESTRRLQQNEEIRILMQKVEQQETTQEQLRIQCNQLSADNSFVMAVEECRARIEESEAKLAAMESDLLLARPSALAPHVRSKAAQAQRLDSTKEVEHEAPIR